jgi:DNA-binding MarR family transcriptional regulator
MAETFRARFFFGAVDRFRERLICSADKGFDVDIFSLTLSQQRLLRELALQTTPDSPGVSLKTLAEELNLSSSAVSVMVEMLVRKKVLERRASEIDRRQVLIRLSGAAWKEIEKFDKACSDFFGDLSEAEQRLLEKISGKLSGCENLTLDKPEME